MKFKFLLIVIAVCFAIITCNTDSSLGVQAPELRVVALSGTQAPGLDSLAEFGGSPSLPLQTSNVFNAPVINASGQTAFESGTNRGRQVFSEGSGTLDLVGPNSTSQSAQIRLNAAGQTVYKSIGIFSKKPGEALETVMQRGDQAPGADIGVTFLAAIELGLSDSGRITFNAALIPEGESSTSDRGIFSLEAGVLTPVIMDGDLSPVPSGDGFNLPFTDIGNHSVNASGQIVFGSRLGIFTVGQGEPTPAILPSNPEFPFIINFFQGAPKINASGQTASFADLNQPGKFASREAVFSTGSGELRLVAMEGDQAPGVELGVMFRRTSFATTPEVLLNDAGQTSFVSFLAGENVNTSNDTAVFSERLGVLELVARAGDQVPGAEGGLSFTSFGNLEFNVTGQLAFSASLSDGSQDDTAIFATDLDGELIEIVRSGDLIDVNDDPAVEDLRSVSALRFTEENFAFSSGGRSSSSLNDSGQLAFTAEFDDGSEAVLVSNRAVFDDVLLGDVNLNGEVDFSDISPFHFTACCR